MTDTPEHIKELQLKLWLQKTPSERLETYLQENETIFLQWTKNKTKEEVLRLQLEKFEEEKKIHEAIRIRFKGEL